jgi:hypothetical protein
MYQSAARRASGAIICVDPSGRESHTDTKQCCHCGEHFPYQKGSGTIRGFCTRCMEMTCGKHRCMECFPIEERMDLYEKGIIPDLLAPRDSINMKKVLLP